MATAWQGLGRLHPVQGSVTGKAKGIVSEDADVLHLCDVIVTNDLKEEYYYSVNDVATDAFQAHLKIAERDPKKYAEIIQLMRPVSLEAHKVIAALYLWNYKINRPLAQELLREVRPSWRLTFFTALRKAPAYAKINGHWNRSVRAMVRELVKTTEPYFIMKYAEKLRPIISKAHLREDNKTEWLYHRKLALTRDYSQVGDLMKAVKSTKEGGTVDYLLAVLDRVNLPYTVVLGILGNYSRHPVIAKHLIRLMTPWETILSLRKLENTKLDLNDSETLERITKKITGPKLQTMKVDPVELFQAHSNITNPNLQSILRILINQQVKAISEATNAKIGKQAKVCVVFDTSGSMEQVAEWSLMLAYAIGNDMPNASFIAFANQAHNLDNLLATSKDSLDAIIKLKANWHQFTGGTALGLGLMAALAKQPDVIFFISDFEGNIEPWSDKVYTDYKAMHNKFPSLITIKATASPWTATGEVTALRTGRWLGIPEELPVTVRNLWDLPTILEYVLNLLPELRKRGILKEPAYVA
jgi:hypothetical protein